MESSLKIPGLSRNRQLSKIQHAGLFPELAQQPGMLNVAQIASMLAHLHHVL